MLEVMPLIQLWALEYRTAINISDQKQKKVSSMLKVEHQQSKIKGKEVKEDSKLKENMQKKPPCERSIRLVTF